MPFVEPFLAAFSGCQDNGRTHDVHTSVVVCTHDCSLSGMYPDPWGASTMYSTEGDGMATVSFSVDGFTLSGPNPVAGRVVVVHDSNGVRVGCGVLKSTVGEVATIGTYPGYSGTLGVKGTVVVEPAAEGISITGTVGGLEAGAAGGLHVHSGFTVADADGVGGHYFYGTSNDPWTGVNYPMTNANGVTSVNMIVASNFTLRAGQAVSMRAMVVHASNGDRVGGGLISTEAAADVVEASVSPTPAPTPAPTIPAYLERAKSAEATRPHAAVATLGAYPGYTGSLALSGTVVVQDTMAGIRLKGTVTGLELSKVGGIHIHSGVTCDDANAVGGHYFGDMPTDPWADTTYASNAMGIASVDLAVGTFSLGGDYPVAGRVVVVHDTNGDRVGCGVLESTVGEVVTIGTYPGYSGTYENSTTGTLVVTNTEMPDSFGVRIQGTISGLEPNESGGFHIHSGKV